MGLRVTERMSAKKFNLFKIRQSQRNTSGRCLVCAAVAACGLFSLDTSAAVLICFKSIFGDTVPVIFF